jgi:carbon monoxide dehydrogenase subunit G
MRVRYAVTADVSGRLASLGSQLVEPRVRSDIEAYFEAVGDRARQR